MKTPKSDAAEPKPLTDSADVQDPKHSASQDSNRLSPSEVDAFLAEIQQDDQELDKLLSGTNS